MKIDNLSGIDLVSEFNKKINESDKPKENSFGRILNNALNEVNELQVESENYDKLLATNQVSNLHEVTIAAEKADIAMQITLTVRNKIVDAYKEIMRMQI